MGDFKDLKIAEDIIEQDKYLQKYIFSCDQRKAIQHSTKLKCHTASELLIKIMLIRHEIKKFISFRTKYNKLFHIYNQDERKEVNNI